VAGSERVDLLLVSRGLAESRALAQRLVMAGQVRADGEVVDKPSRRVPVDAQLAVDTGPQYVSRGGDKLAGGLAAFAVGVQDAVCADVGASTGGFTDCLLQRGAARVYAIDVGHGILHWRLRSDPRVILLERTNARNLAALPEPIGLATIDASFISLKLLLPAVVGWLAPSADVIALVKPQFEAGRQAVGRGGVVRRPEIHREVLASLLPHVSALGLAPQGLIRSPLLGPKGNVEFLLWCRLGAEAIDSTSLIEGVLISEA
jgi:23S rRNA (cytidine1920-2'-O)/16S rRNA (cytidine1409-2'-O)-methyltransferase